MGRKAPELAPAQKLEIETLAAVLSTEQIADYLGISRRTFHAMMERDEEIAARYKKAKAKAIGAIAQGLITKARNGDTVSMIFYLKTQGGWREKSDVEMSGPGGLPIIVDSAKSKLEEPLDRYTVRAAIEVEGEPMSAAEWVQSKRQAIAKSGTER